MANQFDFMFSAIHFQENWLSGDSDTSQIELECYKYIPWSKSCTTKYGLIRHHRDFFYIILHLI